MCAQFVTSEGKRDRIVAEKRASGAIVGPYGRAEPKDWMPEGCRKTLSPDVGRYVHSQIDGSTLEGIVLCDFSIPTLKPSVSTRGHILRDQGSKRVWVNTANTVVGPGNRVGRSPRFIALPIKRWIGPSYSPA